LYERLPTEVYPIFTALGVKTSEKWQTNKYLDRRNESRPGHQGNWSGVGGT